MLAELLPSTPERPARMPEPTGDGEYVLTQLGMDWVPADSKSAPPEPSSTSSDDDLDFD